MSPAALNEDALRRALRDAEWREAPVTDDISPLTPVELPTPLAVRVPVSTPRLFVGVCRTDDASAPGLDVVVSSDDELVMLARACESNPNAAIALAQLLRTTADLGVEAALVAESLAYSTLLGGAEFVAWRDIQPARTRRDSTTPVTIADDGEKLTITLNRPEVHNAYDARTRDALTDALRSALMLGERRTVELRGNGPSFCSGGDLSEFGANHDPARAHLIRTARSPGLLLHGLGVRAIAHVHGACVGAGTELPAFCAQVTARRDATFQLPEVAMGLIPGAGGTVSVTRRIGRQRTAWLAISGSTLDASTANRWGLVDALVD